MPKKLSHKERAKRLLESHGWTVDDVEKHLRHTFVTVDLFNFADLIAFNDEFTLLVQVTDPSHVPQRVEKCLDEPQLRGWLKGLRRRAEVWGMRNEPIRDGSMVKARSFELVDGDLIAYSGSEFLSLTGDEV